ncbi:hypothetical protein KAR91_86460 [Candidatus Pacearchaeota archaeon]|nr:hypothetical protein [Candidatus Pacearchaeota archaeon]
MSAEYLDDDAIKETGLKNGQRMDSTYSQQPHGDSAYGYAARRCGFSNPPESDEYYVLKQYWLIEIMTLYFYYEQLRKYVPKFDVEGIKLSQVARGLREMIKYTEEQFAKAKEDDLNSHIFITDDAAEAMFGDTIVDSGIKDDELGNYYIPTTIGDD